MELIVEEYKPRQASTRRWAGFLKIGILLLGILSILIIETQFDYHLRGYGDLSPVGFSCSGCYLDCFDCFDRDPIYDLIPLDRPQLSLVANLNDALVSGSQAPPIANPITLLVLVVVLILWGLWRQSMRSTPTPTEAELMLAGRGPSSRLVQTFTPNRHLHGGGTVGRKHKRSAHQAFGLPHNRSHASRITHHASRA